MQTITLTMTDASISGKATNSLEVQFSTALTTVKDIIEARVRAEVDQYNQKMPEYFKGLIEPGEAEKTLNGYKLKEKRKLDAEKQCFVALEAFQKNGFFLLIDNIQSEALDQMIVINEHTKISFIKLTPLVGG
jgi:hypothetical protein